jgi:hypothetical protein
MDSAKETDKYKLNGGGVESLFLEWIMKSLSHNGVSISCITGWNLL